MASYLSGLTSYITGADEIEAANPTDANVALLLERLQVHRNLVRMEHHLKALTVGIDVRGQEIVGLHT